ncbi:hypothetical protein KVR01_000087 [Diaporthe batatas]|uniref:uncharacterized protein n=1 Tax=Diaporthe batatas TaxID=748121 RepID=UPI001D056756|nr:uncharacterized protein KVR01_000087 [Diaporthe batatas]KAG8169342.1 hypothetical protein KVR01_000087 [Diaporthe batatas]
MVDDTNTRSPIEQAEHRINHDGQAAMPVTLESVITANSQDVSFGAEDNRSLETGHPSESYNMEPLPSTTPRDYETHPSEASAGQVYQSQRATLPGTSDWPLANGSRVNETNEDEARSQAGGTAPHNATPGSPIITTDYSRTEPMQYEHHVGSQAQFVAEHDPEHHGACRQRCIRTWEVVKRPGPREMREAWEVETIWATWLLYVSFRSFLCLFIYNRSHC